MSDSKVVTHARFATPDRLKELADQGVVVVDETRDLSELPLQEPQYGETIIGSLETAEKHLFFALYDGQRELEDQTRTLMGNQITRVGQRVRESDRSKDIREALRDEEVSFDSDDEARTYFRLQKQVGMLHANFHWAIGERLNAHEYVLGVRSGGRIVQVERRF